MNERESLAALYSFIPFGPARTRLLISFFGSCQKAWKASRDSLRKIGLREEIISRFATHRKNFDPKYYFNRLNKLSIRFITFYDVDYPENLLEIEDSPCLLYVKGSLEKKDLNAVAIVGSRKMTSYGREVTENFSGELTNYGITIISGLARGVDTAAHVQALANNGRTIAVLAGGLDRIYPPENIALSEKISGSGALISEYPLGHPALRTNFASRNRIISGLSKAILVVEGQKKSGTLLTATHAASQGRPVFAVPGQINSPMSEAPLFLIKQGAKMVTAVSDILEELNLQFVVDREKVERVFPSNPKEKTILEILANEPFHLDEVARITRLNVADVSATLTVMELKGTVKNIGNGIYKKI